jgi:hypothetical protein
MHRDFLRAYLLKKLWIRKDNMKMDLKKTGCEDRRWWWTELVQVVYSGGLLHKRCSITADDLHIQVKYNKHS